MGSRKKKSSIVICDGRGPYNYNRNILTYDDKKEEFVRLHPPFVYNCDQWKEHWDDIVGYDDPDHPFRLKDMVIFNRPEDIHPDFMQEAARQLTAIINARVGIELQNLEVMLSFSTGYTCCTNGYTYTQMDIVFYGNGSRFWIKWKSLLPGQEYIPMSQPVTGEDIRFDTCR